MKINGIKDTLIRDMQRFVDCGLESRFLVYNTMITTEIVKRRLLDKIKADADKRKLEDSIEEKEEA